MDTEINIVDGNEAQTISPVSSSRSFESTFQENDDGTIDSNDDNSPDYILIENQHSIINSKKTPCFSNFCLSSLRMPMLTKPIENKRSSCGLAIWNITSLLHGTSIMALPYAIQNGGWLCVIMIFIISFLCCHSGKLLVSCLYEVSDTTSMKRRVRSTYSDIAAFIYGTKGKRFIDFLILIDMFCRIIVQIVLLAIITNDVMNKYAPYLELKFWAAMNCLVVLPFLFLKRVKILSILSAISTIAMILAIIATVVFVFTEPNLLSQDNIGSFHTGKFPVSIGIIIFTVQTHYILPQVETSMKDPKMFNMAINNSYFLTSVVKMTLSILLAMVFGVATNDVISTNLSHWLFFHYFTTICLLLSGMLSLHQEMVIFASAWDDMFIQVFPSIQRDKTGWIIITRPLLLSFALVLAIEIPHFALLIGFIGCTTGSLIGLVLPCIFHMKLHWQTIRSWDIAFEFLTAIFGVVASVLGFVISIKEFVMTFD